MLAFGIVSLFVSALLASAQTANGPTDKDPIFITSPVESTTGLHTGKHLIIEWNTNPKAPEFVDIELLQDFALRNTIASHVKSGNRKYDWEIPETLESSGNYAIRIGNTDYLSYSHPFAIKGLGDTVPVNDVTNGGERSALMQPTSVATKVNTATGFNIASGLANGSAHEMATSSVAMSTPSGSASSTSSAPLPSDDICSTCPAQKCMRCFGTKYNIE
ncbi:unnamed protein product [Umbelopsis vinacea]